jgi:hypothetical protein
LLQQFLAVRRWVLDGEKEIRDMRFITKRSDESRMRKRSIIETVNDELKNICQVEHFKHRSIGNFLTNLVCGIIAFHFLPKKPSLRYETVKTNQSALS